MMLTTFSKKVIDISNLEQSNAMVNINNTSYHVQYYKQEAMILNELTGNYLAKYFGLPVPGLTIFENNNKYGLLYTVIDGITLNGNRTSLYKFIEDIYNKYHDEKLVKQLLTVIVIDIIMGNPCRYRSTLLFNDENKSLKLNSLTGFAYSYLAYNDMKHPSSDALEVYEKHNDLYNNVLNDLVKIMFSFHYLQNLLKEILNLDMRNIIDEVEDFYDIGVPSYLISRVLNHECQNKDLVRKKILGR